MTSLKRKRDISNKKELDVFTKYSISDKRRNEKRSYHKHYGEVQRRVTRRSNNEK